MSAALNGVLAIDKRVVLMVVLISMSKRCLNIFAL
mgnify:CR=1 FL=1